MREPRSAMIPRIWDPFIFVRALGGDVTIESSATPPKRFRFSLAFLTKQDLWDRMTAEWRNIYGQCTCECYGFYGKDTALFSNSRRVRIFCLIISSTYWRNLWFFSEGKKEGKKKKNPRLGLWWFFLWKRTGDAAHMPESIHAKGLREAGAVLGIYAVSQALVGWVLLIRAEDWEFLYSNDV